MLHLHQIGADGEVQRRLQLAGVGHAAQLGSADLLDQLQRARGRQVEGRRAHGVAELDVDEPRRHVDQRDVGPVAVDDEDAVEAVAHERAALVEQRLDEDVPAQRHRAREVEVVRRVAVHLGREEDRLRLALPVEALARRPRPPPPPAARRCRSAGGSRGPRASPPAARSRGRRGGRARAARATCARRSAAAGRPPRSGTGRSRGPRRPRRSRAPPPAARRAASTPRRGPGRAAPAGGPRVVGRAAVEGLRAARVEAAAGGHPRRVGQLARQHRPPHVAARDGVGTTESSACVYGCCGSPITCSVVPCSTMRPRYITATRSHSARPATSCVMKMRPRRRAASGPPAPAAPGCARRRRGPRPARRRSAPRAAAPSRSR